MDLPPTSKLSFLSREGEIIAAPSEWQPAWLEVNVPQEKLQQTRLWLQDKKLPLLVMDLSGKFRVLAEWPRSNPGYYQLRLEYQNEIEEQTIAVWPQKISREAFAQMLEDLDSRLPTSVAIGLQRTGALAGLKLPQLSETTLAQELLRLRRAINGAGNRLGLSEILSQLARNPHQILKTNEIRVRQDQVRRPPLGGLVQAFFRGHNLDVSGRPIRLPDVRVEHTVNVYENQLVRLFFELVNQRLRRIRQAFEADPKGKPLEEIKFLFYQLKKARQQAAFLDEVSQPKYLPNQITMVLLNRPLYHAALEGYLEFIRSPAVRLDDSDLDAPLENLYKLYQIWGTLWIIATLLEVAIDKGYKVETQCLVARDKTGVYVRILPNGQPALVLIHPQHKTKIKLIPERSYGKDGELRSASVTLRPDVAVEIKLANGSQQVYLFDPKYKLESEPLENTSNEGKPKTADIQKMHTYHDAIQNREGRQVVNYAAIIYPGSYVSHSNAEIEALPAYPGAESILQEHLRRVLNKALEVS
ncbi:DUF2357 domain-containing protein [Nostoc sp. ChiVER01]|uniref:DUF2357 domain-containing protein n=1 Tax=Nostoc sp. ChiVER01 TaxID=3075382 RepID=UPI002AD45CA6|nr:DUF2357 domain-containing protein [Nostoc sp. ChiVER01]MDZ8223454.1 DUF2357 domain-containing protein [Nostoc sp. ChiVER01]